eukprot:s119_g34.t1
MVTILMLAALAAVGTALVEPEKLVTRSAGQISSCIAIDFSFSIHMADIVPVETNGQTYGKGDKGSDSFLCHLSFISLQPFLSYPLFPSPYFPPPKANSDPSFLFLLCLPLLLPFTRTISTSIGAGPW